MRAASWRIRKVKDWWCIFEPGWAITPLAWTHTHPQAVKLLPVMQEMNVTTRREPRVKR